MDKDTLFSKRAADDVTTVDLSMGTVTVRSVTRVEVEATTEGLDQDDPAQRLMAEANMFAVAVVDPALTADDWREWFKLGRVADYVKLATVVKEVSGVGIDAAKSHVRPGKKRRGH